MSATAYRPRPDDVIYSCRPYPAIYQMVVYHLCRDITYMFHNIVTIAALTGQCHGWIIWFQVLCLGATIVGLEQKDPYLTYWDDQWTPTADGQNMRWHDKQGHTFFVSSEASSLRPT